MNRCQLARERAGLTLEQAIKLAKIAPARLEEIEAGTGDPLSLALAEQLAELYGVRVEWLTGRVARHDYAPIDGMKGAGTLTARDRDTLAEFAASMPRRKR